MKKRFSLFLIPAAAMLLAMAFSVTAFAEKYEGESVYQGLSGIQPGDTLVLPEDTTKAWLTARWGVRVIFEDWDEEVLKEELVELDPVTPAIPGSTVVPADPTRKGYKFVRWERIDKNGDSMVHIDGKNVVDVYGPGPIIFQAVYEKLPEPTTKSPSGGGGGGIVTPYPKGTTAAATSAQAADPAGSEDGEDIDPFRMGLLNATGDRTPIGLLAAALVILLSAFAAVDHKDRKKTQ